MENNNDLHIIKNTIKAYYKNKYHWPLIYLAILLVLLLIFPIISLISPSNVNKNADLASMKKHNRVFGHYTLSDIYFTGYTSSWLNNTQGYYYYTSINGEIVILLLSPETCEQGNPIIKDITFDGKLMKKGKAVDLMLTYLADDLNWTDEGIFATVSPYVISEPAATGPSTVFFLFVYVGSFIFTILAILLHTIFYLFPKFSPTVLLLHKFGNPFEILEQAEEEIATLPQLASEDLYITPNYFIRLSILGVAIVPIKHIIWIYKSPQAKHFLWHKYKITFTLHIVAAKHHEVRCPENTKNSTEGIIDYLTEANHSIITGYSEESRIKAERIQNARSRKLLRKLLGYNKKNSSKKL